MMTGKKKSKSTGSREAVMDELVCELRQFRAVLRDVGENFILRREGEIETIISHLAAIPAASLKREAPGLLHDIRGLKLKPAKGRLRDLKGIDELIEGVAERVISAQK